MQDFKKYWLHSLILIAIGVLIGLCVPSCHSDPSPVASKESEKHSESHTKEKSDSSHTERNTRVVKAPVVPGYLPSAQGVRIPSDLPVTGCSPFTLPLTLIPGEDFTSYYTLAIDEIDPSTLSFRGIHAGHSMLMLTVTDSSSTAYHTLTRTDTKSDSTMSERTVFWHPTWSIDALLSTPVFHEGALQWSPTETKAALRANLYLGEVLAIGVRPELPVLNPSLKNWQVDLDLSFTLAAH